MRRYLSQPLFTAFLVTFLLYAVIFVSCLWELPISRPPWHIGLLLYFHSIPMFFLQLFLHRRGKRFLRPLLFWLPLLLVAAWALAVCQGDLRILIFWSIWCLAPLTGRLLAWLVHIISQKCFT